MKRLLNSLIAGFIVVPLPFSALAQTPAERWYEVEIILFEQLNPEARYSEQWPLDPGEIDTSDSIELQQPPGFNQPWLSDVVVDDSPAEPAVVEPDVNADGFLNRRVLSEMPRAYQILPKADYQLNEAYQRIGDSRQYRPLLHIAWQQAVPPRDQADHILIHDQIDKPAIQAYPPLLMASEAWQTKPQPPSEAEEQLRGLIKLSIARYLHLETDLLFHQPVIEDESPASTPAMTWQLPDIQPVSPAPFPLSPLLSEPQAEPEFFRIQAKLRTRSREVHYLDHPLVGMLVLFTPVELPQPAEEEIIEPQTDEPVLLQPLMDDPRVIQDDSF